LGHQLVGTKTVELHASLERVIEVSIVARVAEHASSHNVLKIISVWMTLRKEMIPALK
jgi:hypothetical protein